MSKKCIWIIPRKCTAEEKAAGDAALKEYQDLAYADGVESAQRQEYYKAYKLKLFNLGLGVLPGLDLCYVGKWTMEEFQRVRFVREGSGYHKRFGGKIAA